MKQTNETKKSQQDKSFKMARKKTPHTKKHGLCFVLVNCSWVGAFPGAWFIQPMMVHWKTRSFSFLQVLTANTLSIRGSIHVHFPFSGWDFSVWPRAALCFHNLSSPVHLSCCIWWTLCPWSHQPPLVLAVFSNNSLKNLYCMACSFSTSYIYHCSLYLGET